MGRIQGLTKIGRKPDRVFRSEKIPKDMPYVTANEQLWRDIEDAGHTIVAFNGGQMLRIDDKVDIYVRSLKWRYTRTQHNFKIITWADKKAELLNVLSNAPRAYVPVSTRIDGPVMGRGPLKSVQEYKKSI